MGSNGLTSARHDLLSNHYAQNYPETFDSNVDENLIYCGPYRLQDPLPNSNMLVGEAILSPTRTYAPVIYKLRRELGGQLKGVVHCSGGAQTKCMRFGKNIRFVKDNLFPTPPLFRTIQAASGSPDEEMYKVFNMGHRMEVFVTVCQVDSAIDIARSFGVDAQQVGYTESYYKTSVSLTTPSGQHFSYYSLRQIK